VPTFKKQLLLIEEEEQVPHQIEKNDNSPVHKHFSISFGVGFFWQRLKLDSVEKRHRVHQQEPQQN